VSWISFEESDGSDLEFMVEDLEKFLSGIQSISDENITSKNDYKGYKVVEQMNNRKRQVNTDQNSVIKRTKLDICYERRTDDQNEREYEGNHLSGSQKEEKIESSNFSKWYKKKSYKTVVATKLCKKGAINDR
jgi:hypothetical protein